MKMTMIVSGAVFFIMEMTCFSGAQVWKSPEDTTSLQKIQVVSFPVDEGKGTPNSSLLNKNDTNVACTSGAGKQTLKDAVKEVLKNHPEILLSLIDEHAMTLAEAVERGTALKVAQEEERRLMDELANPKNPDIDSSRPIRGNREGTITIVEYSDFQCPYCAAAHTTIKNLLEHYGPSVRFVYKHNPLSFHDLAEPAARYFEAIAMQNPELAWEFHDRVFEQQSELGTEGEAGLWRIASTFSLDLSQLTQDMESDRVTERLARDLEETQRFGFDGTPAFLVNGVSVMGNRPQEEFVELIRMFHPLQESPDPGIARSEK